MEALASFPGNNVLVLMVVYYVLAVGQTVHTFFLVSHRNVKHSVASVSYEALLVVHSLAFSVLVYATVSSWSYLGTYHGSTYIPGEYLLWANACALAVGVALCVVRRRVGMLSELVLLLFCTPPAVQVLWQWLPLVLIVDAAFFAVRTVRALVGDVRSYRRTVSRISTIDAIKLLPEGVLYADTHGRVLLMNDAMRSCLTSLGFSTDLADMSGLMESLRKRAQSGVRDGGASAGAGMSVEPGVGASADVGTHANANLGTGVTIQVSENEIRQFVEDEVVTRTGRCQRIIAYDFTEEELLNLSIARTNRQLELAGEELRVSMANVAEVADNDALLRMRSRVHDIIGQRLSVLHRYLENGDLADESLAGIEATLNSILGDLAAYDHPDLDPAADLDAIIEAFALVNLRIDVQGALPANCAVARAFVHVIREASTNAAKHAQASLVCVTMEHGEQAYTLTVCNDGLPFAGTMREGTGLPGMKRALCEVGGTLSVQMQPVFTVSAVVGNKEVLA